MSCTIWLRDYYTQTHTPTLQDFLSLQATRCGQQLWRPSALKSKLSNLHKHRFRAKVKYWPLVVLWVCILTRSRRVELNMTWRLLHTNTHVYTSLLLFDTSNTMRAAAPTSQRPYSQWHTLPSHIYHRNHPAYSTHSVNTQYTLSRHYNKHTVNTCKNWEIWSMWVLTYSLLH